MTAPVGSATTQAEGTQRKCLAPRGTLSALVFKGGIPNTSSPIMCNMAMSPCCGAIPYAGRCLRCSRSNMPGSPEEAA